MINKSNCVKILLLFVLPFLVVGCANKSQIRQDLTKHLDSITKESLALLENQSYIKSYSLMHDLYVSDDNTRQTIFQEYKKQFEWSSNQTIWLDTLRTLWQQKHTEWDVWSYGRDVYVIKGYELGWKDGDFYPGHWYYYDYPEVESVKRFEPADFYASQLYYEIMKSTK